VSIFRFERVAKDDPRMAELFRLRYQVYCVERGFESPEDHPNGLEFDEYDQYSSHFCAVAIRTGKIIGTIRIVHDSPIGLPIERYCELDAETKFSGNPQRVGEISRLAISKDFKRREKDKAIHAAAGVDLIEDNHLYKERRAFEGRIVAGLQQCVYQESPKLGLTHMYAAMSRGVFCLVSRWGVAWTKVGEQVEYHGLRGPYLAAVVPHKM